METSPSIPGVSREPFTAWSRVLSALNETYYLSEKRLAADLGSFHFQPDHFLERISGILGTPGAFSAPLQESLAQTEALYHELAMLVREREG